MAYEQYANNAATTLNGGINNSTTSVVVTAGSVFPSVGNFRVIVDNEIMLVTARSTNTLTVTRGAEGTTGASHSSGAAITLILTKVALQNLFSDRSLFGAAASRPAAGVSGRLYHCSDEQFIAYDDSTKWVSFYRGARMWNPNDLTFTIGRDYSGGGTAFTSKEFSKTIKETSVGSSGVGYNSWTRPAPTAPYTLTALLSFAHSNAVYQMPAIGFRNTSDDKVKYIRFWARPDGQNQIFATTQTVWGNSGPDVATHNVSYSDGHIWLQLEDNTTNHYFRYSFDGINFIDLFSHSRTAYMAAPDLIWFGTQLFGSGEIVATNLLSWHEG